MNKQEILQGVYQQTSATVNQAYQGRISLLSMAATLATLPNWEEVLENEMQDFLKSVDVRIPQLKDHFGANVPVDMALEVRNAVSQGAEDSVAELTKHFSMLKAKVLELLGQE